MSVQVVLPGSLLKQPFGLSDTSSFHALALVHSDQYTGSCKCRFAKRGVSSDYSYPSPPSYTFSSKRKKKKYWLALCHGWPVTTGLSPIWRRSHHPIWILGVSNLGTRIGLSHGDQDALIWGAKPCKTSKTQSRISVMSTTFVVNNDTATNRPCTDPPSNKCRTCRMYKNSSTKSSNGRIPSLYE